MNRTGRSRLTVSACYVILTTATLMLMAMFGSTDDRQHDVVHVLPMHAAVNAQQQQQQQRQQVPDDPATSITIVFDNGDVRYRRRAVLDGGRLTRGNRLVEDRLVDLLLDGDRHDRRRTNIEHGDTVGLLASLDFRCRTIDLSGTESEVEEEERFRRELGNLSYLDDVLRVVLSTEEAIPGSSSDAGDRLERVVDQLIAVVNEVDASDERLLPVFLDVHVPSDNE